ncbi:MAG: hypothetical protein EOP46_20410, partial [Sphingobacteriaceae bacterium]
MGKADIFIKNIAAKAGAFNKRIKQHPLYAKWKKVTEDKRRLKRIQIQQHDIMDCGAACLASISAYY